MMVMLPLRTVVQDISVASANVNISTTVGTPVEQCNVYAEINAIVNSTDLNLPALTVGSFSTGTTVYLNNSALIAGATGATGTTGLPGQGGNGAQGGVWAVAYNGGAGGAGGAGSAGGAGGDAIVASSAAMVVVTNKGTIAGGVGGAGGAGGIGGGGKDRQ